MVGKHKIPTLVIGTGGKEYDESYFYPDKMDFDDSSLEYLLESRCMLYEM